MFVRCAVRYIGAPHVPDASDRVVGMMRVKDLALREGWEGLVPNDWENLCDGEDAIEMEMARMWPICRM